MEYEIAVVIGFRRAARAIAGLVPSRWRANGRQMHISIVDNSRSKAEADCLERGMRPGETLKMAPQIMDCSRAITLGAQVRRADHILLMEPDIIVGDSDVVEKAVSMMERDPVIEVLVTVRHTDDASMVEVARAFPHPLRQFTKRILPARCGELR